MKKVFDELVLVLGILFLSLAFLSDANACSTRTVSELNECKVKDKWQEIIKRLRPNEEYVIEPRQDINDTRTLFERLSMNNKPTIANMKAELDVWRAEILPMVSYREDLRNLKYGAMGASRCGFGRPNHATLKMDLIRDLDQAKLTCLKEKEIEIQSEIDEIVSKENQRKLKSQIIKNYDCESVTEPYLKHICELNKLRL